MVKSPRFIPLLVSLLFLLPQGSEGGEGIVKGTVSSQNGIRLEGARVEIEGIARTETDPGGRFFFPRVPAGFYKLEVSKKGFPAINRAFLVKPAGVQSLDIMLPGLAVSSPGLQKTVVPLRGRGNALLVPVRIPGEGEMVFLLDTGATYCALSTSKASQLGVRPRAQDPIVEVRTASGVLQAPMILLPSLAVGGLEERKIEALIIPDAPVPGQAEGILGLSFLGRFQFTISPEEGQLILSR